MIILNILVYKNYTGIIEIFFLLKGGRRMASKTQPANSPWEVIEGWLRSQIELAQELPALGKLHHVDNPKQG